MKGFFVGTIILVAAAVLGVIIGGSSLPKIAMIIPIFLAAGGFSLQLVSAWRNRPSVWEKKFPEEPKW